MNINIKKNLRTFDKIENVSFTQDENFNKNNIKLFVPEVPTKKSLYYLENVLSDLECETLINNSSEKYSSLKNDYLEAEREGNRLLTINDEFANILYERINQYIEHDIKIQNCVPCGFGVEGNWKPFSINNCFRFNQYIAPSIGFKPHRDATFIENEDIRSILTILIYLNDDFEGGDTVFYDTFGKRLREDLVEDEMKKGFVERFRYKPKKGSVLIFNHNMIHEGGQLYRGTKYVVRSDIVFKRTTMPHNYSWKTNPFFLLAVHYFRKAINYELDGDLENASIYYQKELAIRQTQNA